jgi:hypothetical protein
MFLIIKTLKHALPALQARYQLIYPSLYIATHLSTKPPISLLHHLSLYYAACLSTVLSQLSLYLGPHVFSAANLSTQTHISLLSQLCLCQYSIISLLLLSHPSLFLATHLSTKPPISLLRHLSLYYATYLSAMLHISLQYFATFLST